MDGYNYKSNMVTMYQETGSRLTDHSFAPGYDERVEDYRIRGEKNHSPPRRRDRSRSPQSPFYRRVYDDFAARDYENDYSGSYDGRNGRDYDDGRNGRDYDRDYREKRFSGRDRQRSRSRDDRDRGRDRRSSRDRRDESRDRRFRDVRFTRFKFLINKKIFKQAGL